MSRNVLLATTYVIILSLTESIQTNAIWRNLSKLSKFVQYMFGTYIVIHKYFELCSLYRRNGLQIGSQPYPYPL